MKRVLIKLIRLYQMHISSRSGPVCKYHPTCSQYGIEAIDMHGAFKGTFLTIWRFVRCNPFSHGGYDPVPEKGIKNKTEDK